MGRPLPSDTIRVRRELSDSSTRLRHCETSTASKVPLIRMVSQILFIGVPLKACSRFQIFVWLEDNGYKLSLFMFLCTFFSFLILLTDHVFSKCVFSLYYLYTVIATISYFFIRLFTVHRLVCKCSANRCSYWILKGLYLINVHVSNIFRSVTRTVFMVSVSSVILMEEMRGAFSVSLS